MVRVYIRDIVAIKDQSNNLYSLLKIFLSNMSPTFGVTANQIMALKLFFIVERVSAITFATI